MKLFLNVRKKSFSARRVLVVLVLFSGCAAIAVDASSGGIAVYKAVTSLQICVLAAGMFLSSLWELKHASVFAKVSLVLQLTLLLDGISCLCGKPSLPWDRSLAILPFMVSAVAAAVFIAGIFRRMISMSLLAKKGTVWGCMELSVEAFNIVVFMLLSVVFSMGMMSDAKGGTLTGYVSVAFMSLQLVAMIIRIWRGSLMVIMSSHEDAIMESFRISQVEIGNGSRATAYRELYDRILEHFEKDKPFLNSSLAISDVAQAVFSNKSYISRVISSYTGRNFRQFVNYYRIAYAMTLFRKDPGLNVTKLSMMAGFNSVVSFNMAFRFFMDENPSEWCRKERYKILKKKK